jgi:hypothetical protein
MDPTTRGILIGCYCHHPDGIGDGHGTALSFPPWTQYSLDLGPIQTSAERPTLAGGMQHYGCAQRAWRVPWFSRVIILACREHRSLVLLEATGDHLNFSANHDVPETPECLLTSDDPAILHQFNPPNVLPHTPWNLIGLDQLPTRSLGRSSCPHLKRSK